MSEICKLHRQFCQYSRTFKGRNDRGIQWLGSCFNVFLEYKPIEHPDQINKRHIERYLMYGKSQLGWAAKTIYNHRQALSSFLDWCVEEELILKNHVKSIPKPKLPEPLPKALAEEDAEYLMTCTRNAEYPTRFQKARAIAIIGGFLHTGLRLNELHNLEMDHVNLEAKTLFVVKGKCDKSRLIPLNPQVIRIFKSYLKERRHLKRRTSYFFASVQEDDQMGVSVVPRLVEKISKLSKITFTAHVLRHTFATLMLENGSNLAAIQKMLGHASIETTMIYLRVTTKHLRGEIAKHPLF